MTHKEAILGLKLLYDKEGIPGAAELFKGMLNRGKSKQVALAVQFLMMMLAKIDTCIEDCFEDIENKKIISCHCNDEPMDIPLNGPFKTTRA